MDAEFDVDERRVLLEGVFYEVEVAGAEGVKEVGFFVAGVAVVVGVRVFSFFFGDCRGLGGQAAA